MHKCIIHAYIKTKQECMYVYMQTYIPACYCEALKSPESLTHSSSHTAAANRAKPEPLNKYCPQAPKALYPHGKP